VNFTKATRSNVPLLIGIAGPSGSGKTYSALRLARGLAGDGPIAFIDTERGRALHYADEFDFLHAELDAPFSPQAYGEALQEAVAQNPTVIVVDSFSHEHAGEGGVLDMQEEEFQRLGAREAVKFTSWIKPKQAHKRLIAELLQLPVHLIVCLRAEEKIDLVKEDGKLVVKPKRTLAGHVGWIPICGKDLPYELTISLVVTPDNPGVPQPIKLQEQHRALVHTDVPLDEATGERLAAWAKGSDAATATPSAVGEPASEEPEAASLPSPASDVPHQDADASDVASVPSAPKLITRAQRARLFAIAREYGVEKDHIRTLLLELTGSESTAELSVEHYESLVQLIQSRDPVNA
jgi:AAA domain-containing protein